MLTTGWQISRLMSSRREHNGRMGSNHYRGHYTVV